MRLFLRIFTVWTLIEMFNSLILNTQGTRCSKSYQYDIIVLLPGVVCTFFQPINAQPKTVIIYIILRICVRLKTLCLFLIFLFFSCIFVLFVQVFKAIWNSRSL